MRLNEDQTRFIASHDSKISQSCDLCKSKKVKCDQKKPSCEYCSKHKQDCIYSERKKPGLKAGYGQKVLDRLTQLEETVNLERVRTSTDMDQLKRKVQELENTLRSIDAVKPGTSKSGTSMPLDTSSINVSSIPSSSVAKDSVSQLDINLLVDHASEDNESKHQASGISGSIHSTETYSESPLGPRLSPNGLPSFNQTEILFSIFLDKIHPIFPIVHVASIMDILRTCNETPKPQVYGIILCSLRYAKSTMSTEDIKYYHAYCKDMILSTSFNVSNIDKLQAMSLLAFDFYGKSNNPDTWSIIAIISSGVRHLNLLSEKNHNISVTQVKKNGRKRSKNISTKNVKLLKTPCSWLEEESRRNLFWEIYVLSHLSSVSNAFGCSIPEDEIRCLLPVKTSLWADCKKNELDNSMYEHQKRSLDNLQSLNSHHNIYGSNCYLIEVIHILGKVHSFMRKPVDLQELKDVLGWQMQFSELESEINQWKKGLPKESSRFLDQGAFSSEKRLTPKDVLFHTLYHTMIIRLNSAAGYPYFNSNYFQFSKEARSKCVNSANSVISLAKKLPFSFRSHDQVIYELCGPQYAFGLWVTSRLLLVNAINTGTKPPQEIDFLVELLSKIGLVWECAAKYAEILNFLLADETEYQSQDFSFKNQLKTLRETDEADSDSLSDSAEDPNGGLQFHSKSATIISDMRLTSYALDVLLSSKIERFKRNKSSISPNNSNDISNLFEWFKLPINNLNDSIIPSATLPSDDYSIFKVSGNN